MNSSPPPPPPPPRWLRPLSVLRLWFCCSCCWPFVYCYSHCYFRFILVLQSSWCVCVRERGLVVLLSLSSCCLVIVAWLFLAVPWVCLQFVIELFPGHTHLLFLNSSWASVGPATVNYQAPTHRLYSHSTKIDPYLKIPRLHYFNFIPD